MFDFQAIFTTHGSDLVYRIPALALILAIGGWLFVVFVRLMGDPGPAYDGRQTINPLSHLDWPGFIFGALMRVGWMRPFAIRPGMIRGGILGLLVAVLGTLAALLALATVLGNIRPFLMSQWGGSLRSMQLVLGAEKGADLAVWFVVANLIPLPPFLAGHIWAFLAPRLWKKVLRHFWVISVAAAIVVFSGYLPDQLLPAVRVVRGWIFP